MSKKSNLQQYQGIEDLRAEYNDANESDTNSSGGEDLYAEPITTHHNNYEQDAKYGSVAPIARIKNPIMMQRVRHVIETIRRRRLTMGEQASLRNFIYSLPSTKLANYNDDEIEKTIVNRWLKGQSSLNKENEVLDTHEMLKNINGMKSDNDTITTSINKVSEIPKIANAVDLSSVLGNNDQYGIQRIINPQALYSKTQILLDSRYRSLDTDGTTLFKWSFSNTLITQQGTFNTISPIRDIIAIKVLGPIKIPYTSYAENPTKNITMYYNEFSNQCVPAQENRKYHHWMDYSVEDDWITLNAEKYNEGTYFFDKPITTLDTLSINFGAPLQIIQFDLDRMNGIFTAGEQTTITFPSAHNLDSGYTIYFSNFTTTDPSNDSVIIAAMNSIYGLKVTRVDITKVTVDVNTSSISGVMNSPVAFFGEKRLYVPLEITYIRSKN